MGWCQLRQLQIHPELATELWWVAPAAAGAARVKALVAEEKLEEVVADF